MVLPGGEAGVPCFCPLVAPVPRADDREGSCFVIGHPSCRAFLRQLRSCCARARRDPAIAAARLRRSLAILHGQLRSWHGRLDTRLIFRQLCVVAGRAQLPRAGRVAGAAPDKAGRLELAAAAPLVVTRPTRPTSGAEKRRKQTTRANQRKRAATIRAPRRVSEFWPAREAIKMLNAHSNLTREHIDQLRQKLAALPNRTPEEHEIELHFKELTRNRLVNNGNLETRFRLAELVIRSGARNALSGRMIGQLTERIDQLERWLEEADAAASAPTGTDLDARCLLIRGHAGTFCSGSDLAGVREALDQPSAWELAQLMQYNLARLEALPVVSVAFVEGYALGGGAELLLAADLRLISGES